MEGARQAGRRFAALLRAAWVAYEQDRARYLAVAMIYYAIVSLIPLLLLLLAVLGLLLRFSAAAGEAQRQMLLGVEAGFGAELTATITRLLTTLQRESIAATVVGFAGVVVASSVLCRHLRLGFRAIWHYEPPLVSGPVRMVVRTMVLEQVIAFALVVAAGGLLLAALGLIAATQWLDRLLGSWTLSSPAIGWLLTALTSLIVAACTFACMLKLLPPVAVRWREVWAAALLCAVAWVAASELLALYGVLFGRGHGAYGALGGLLAVMLWMNIVSQVLFFGAELCKVAAEGETRCTSP